MSTYDEKNIKILKKKDIVEKFGWAKSIELSKEFGKNAKWIHRGLEACAGVGVDESYFINRYLRKIDIPKNKEVDEESNQAYIEMMEAAELMGKKVNDELFSAKFNN